MKKFKVVVTDYTYETLNTEKKILSQLDVDFNDYHYRTEDEVIRVAKDCDVLVVQFAPITRRVIKSLTKCRMIVRYAIGVDNIDLEAATEQGIYVANVPDYGIDEVSTHTVALLLSLARKLPESFKMVRDKKWDYSLVKPLRRTMGTQLGLVALGRIPSAIARKMSGFGMNIVAFDPYVSKEYADSLGVRLVSFDELIAASDYVSIHCPLTNETRGMFNMSVFEKMKKAAILINTARGPIVNERDLAIACGKKIISAAAIDVTEKEPIAHDSPLLQLDNVFITPHISWYTEESIESLKTKLAEEIVRVLKGNVPVNLVNKAVLNK